MRTTMAAVGAVLALGACGLASNTDSPVRARSALEMGEKATLPNGETVQVHGYQAGVRPDVTLGAASDASGAFSVVDAEACAGPDGAASAEAEKFRLEMPDGSHVEPASVSAKDPPLRKPRAPDECSRGTITYELAPGQQPKAVSFAAAQATIRWRVG